MDSTRRCRGQAVILLLAVVVIAALAVIAVAQFSVRIVGRGGAQTAADAAALAGTTGGAAAAIELAVRNGARLVSYREDGAVVTVVVERGGERASARATDGL
jgi:outer membrane lipoprotein SlyB